MIEIGIFFGKALIVLVFLLILTIVIAIAASRGGEKAEFEIEPVHKKNKRLALFLKSFTEEKDDLKEELKQEKKKAKSDKKKKPSQRIFVLTFDGDTKASQVDDLRQEISAVLSIATPKDEVVVKIESPGGVVHGYGLAASQLLRIRERGIPLTVCIDKVAASGGYLMSCVANKIVAAPFAIIGSIGVVAQVPNFNKLLKKHEVDFKEYTAGDFKRTVSILGEITPKGEAKFQEQLESTHVLFKKFVSQHRPQLDIQKIANGEHWYGEEAISLGLIDKIQTSDDYLLLSFEKDTPIFEINHKAKQRLSEKITDMIGQMAGKAVSQSVSRTVKNTLEKIDQQALR